MITKSTTAGTALIEWPMFTASACPNCGTMDNRHYFWCPEHPAYGEER